MRQARQMSSFSALTGSDVMSVLQRHLAGEMTAEGWTPLDTLIAQIRDSQYEDTSVQRALVSVARDIGPEHCCLWVPFELIFTSVDVRPAGLAVVLEEVLVGGRCPDPVARAHIYSMLFDLEVPPMARTLFSDTELRKAAPQYWFDMIYPLLSSADERKEVLMDAVRKGELQVEDLIFRLEVLREVSGRSFGVLVDQIRFNLNKSDRLKFDEAIERAFGVGLNREKAKKLEFEGV